MTEFSVRALADLVGGRLIGDGERLITGIGDLRSAGPDQVGFVRTARYAEAARVTRAGALLLKDGLETDAAQILVADVDVAYAITAQHFHPMPKATAHQIHPTAVVHPEASLEQPVEVGPHAVIGRCRIGSGSVIMAGVVIGDLVSIGRDCVLYPHVTIYDHVTIGDRFVAHAKAVVGSDGFGYALDGSRWQKVPQLGGVEIGDDVEIGSSSVIDRGAVNNTVIGAGVKLDNLCHIAHNCVIGQNVVMAAGCMVAGSTKVGDNGVWGGKSAAAGHVEIAAGVRLGGGTQVLRSIKDPGDYMGYPPVEKRRFVRIQRAMVDLPEIHAEWVERHEGEAHSDQDVGG
ncbi:MAG: UDP-3-O-(3-hydroxymyristoyl)glucosamine N-acyltransferase [Planctomycetes bacterium]|nr:UDP-3-O-(3-hydroxymyristoyl)glucosamine N-acyltransferase [Planctomycetota bacterium]